MGLLNINNVEADAVTILVEQAIERGNLPAEWRSSVAAKNEDDGAVLQFGGEANGAGSV
jgi:hypothetical protein